MNVTSLRRWSTRLSIAVLALLAAIQLVPYGRNHVNPPPTAEPRWNAPETRALARQACFDCHSNETQWPLYAHVAPASWLVYRDVVDGRAALNFSEWNRPQKDAKDAADVLREREMPPPSYRLAHAHARLTGAERERLARGLAATLRVEEGPQKD